jgi:hypothetical protein
MALRSRLDTETGESAGSDTTGDGDSEVEAATLDFEPVGADPDPFLMDYATDRFEVDVDQSDQMLGLLVATVNLL